MKTQIIFPYEALRELLPCPRSLQVYIWIAIHAGTDGRHAFYPEQLAESLVIDPLEACDAVATLAEHGLILTTGYDDLKVEAEINQEYG